MNDPSTIRKTAHVDFNNKNLDNVCFVKLNSVPAIREHLTPIFYVDQAVSHSVHEPTLVKNNQDNDFNNHSLTNKNSNTFNTQAVNDNQVITNVYVHQFHQEKAILDGT